MVDGIIDGARTASDNGTWKRHLVIMLRAPVAGRTKTRLARDIGTTAAVRFYRAACFTLITRLGRDPRWQTTLAITPDTARDLPVWPHRVGPRQIYRIGQGQGGLGQRMQRIMGDFWRGPMIIVGTDIPAITPDDIAAAFRALGRTENAIGPADDGGYWLIGHARRRPPVDLFAGVRWSSEHALDDTEKNLRGGVARLRTLTDVDDRASWHAQHAQAARLIRPDMTPR
ncbi:MAG: DUF2064 domain-containing protein [Pseudomonadota bacterium]